MSGVSSAVHATAPAAFPGTEFRHAAGRLQTELAAPHLTPLPELPGRGHHASLLGRSVARLSELYAELTSYGWRLVSRPGADHHRAAQLLRADVDTLADVRGERADQDPVAPDDPVRLELLGPVSLAAGVALPSGEKVLVDHGARRDLTDSLAAGTAGHLEHVRRSCLRPGGRLNVTLLEPDYARVRTGEVPTVSGYRTIRSLSRDETRAMVGVVVDSLRAAGADEVILDLGAGAPVPEQEHVEDFRGRSASRLDGFGLQVPGLGARNWERVAGLAEEGTRFLAALLSVQEIEHAASAQALPQVTELVSRLTRPWQALGMPPSSLSTMLLTPCGVHGRERLRQLDEASALRAITRVRDAAEALTDQIGAG